MYKRFLFGVISLAVFVFSEVVSAGVVSAVITNIPSASSTNSQIHVVVTATNANQLAVGVRPNNLRFVYTRMDGVPHGASGVTNYEDLVYSSTSGTNALYITSGNIAPGTLPADGTYWYWITTNALNDISLTGRLNLWRYNPTVDVKPYAAVASRLPMDWSYSAAVPGVVGRYVGMSHNYTGWQGTTNVGVTSRSGLLNCFCRTDSVVVSPVFTNGLKQLSFSIWSEQPSDLGELRVYIVTNSLVMPSSAPDRWRTARSNPLEEGDYLAEMVTVCEPNKATNRIDWVPEVDLPDDTPFMIWFVVYPTEVTLNYWTHMYLLQDIYVIPPSAQVSLSASKDLAPVIPPNPVADASITLQGQIENVVPAWPIVRADVKVHYARTGGEAFSSLPLTNVEDNVYGAITHYTNHIWRNSAFTDVMPNGSLPAGKYDYFFEARTYGWSSEATNIVDMGVVYSSTNQFDVSLYKSDYGLDDVWIVREDIVDGNPVQTNYTKISSNVIMTATNTFVFPMRVDEIAPTSDLNFKFMTKSRSNNQRAAYDQTNYWGRTVPVGNKNVPTGESITKDGPKSVEVSLTNIASIAVEVNLSTTNSAGAYMITRAAYQSFNDLGAVTETNKYLNITTASPPQMEYTGFNSPTNTGKMYFHLDETRGIRDTFTTNNVSTNGPPTAYVNTILSPWDKTAIPTNFPTQYYVTSANGGGLMAPATNTQTFVLNLFPGGEVYSESITPTHTWNSDGTIDGINSITFDYSPRSSFQLPRDMAWNMQYFSRANYRLEAVVTDLVTGLDRSSISLLGYIQDRNNFYECRLSQDANATTAQQVTSTVIRTSLELYRWTNGVAVSLAKKTGISDFLWNSNSGNTPTLYFELKTDDVTGNVMLEGDILFDGVIAAHKVAYTNTAAIIKGGTIGVYTLNCAPVFTRIGLSSTENITAGWDFPSPQWKQEAGHLRRLMPAMNMRVDVQSREGKVAPDAMSWRNVTNVISVQDFKVRSMVCSVQSGEGLFFRVRSEYLGGIDYSGLVVDNLGLTSYRGTDQKDPATDEQQPSDGGWKTQGAWIESNVVQNAASDIAVDGVLNFAIARGEPSKALPTSTNIYQWLVSPLMTNGLGSVNFRMKVKNAPAVIRVQYAMVDGAIEKMEDLARLTWIDVKNYPVTETNETSDFITMPQGWINKAKGEQIEYKVGNAIFTNTLKNGYFRIVHERGTNSLGVATNLHAEVLIDDVYAYGYMPADEFAWQGYNMLFANPGLSSIFVNCAWDGSRIGVFNNSQTNNIAPDDSSSSFNGSPFLKSPAIETGVGQLSFYARVLTNGASHAYGQFVVETLPKSEVNNPDAPWSLLPGINEKTTNQINNQIYTNRFVFNYYEPTNNLIRIRVLPGGTETNVFEENGVPINSQLLFEDVLLIEPLRPSFIIDQVELNWDEMGSFPPEKGGAKTNQQPVVGNKLKVDVNLGRFLLESRLTDINVYFTWRHGTNSWGVWSDTEMSPNFDQTISLTKRGEEPREGYTGSISKLGELTFTTNNVYSNVVQYRVWATYKTSTSPTEEITVINEQQYSPVIDFPWYFPKEASLNDRFAPAWSPYYWLYTCLPGNAWLNELNTVDFYSVDSSYAQFVEIAAPEGIDLYGWQLKQVNNEYVPGSAVNLAVWTNPPGSVYNNNMIGSNQVADAINTVVTNNPQEGWAFFTLGNATAVPLDQRMPAACFDSSGTAPYGFLLYRDNGAFEHGVVYYHNTDQEAGARTMYVNSQRTGEPLCFAGLDARRDQTNSLSAIGGHGTNWTSGVPTPQGINNNQELPPLDVDNFLKVTSTISGPGTQRGTTASPISENVIPGYNSSVYTYQAAALHEIKSITTNGASYYADPPASPWTTETIQFKNMTTNIDICVTFVPKADIDSVITNVTTEVLPVFGQDVGFRIQVDAELLADAELYVYVSWTNTLNTAPDFTNWAATNWLAGTVTNDVDVALSGSAPTTQLLGNPTDGYFGQHIIPGDYVAKEEVVQYCVWGIVVDKQTQIPFTTIQSLGSFTNPPAYYPVDLNEEAGANDYQDWSPYYINLSCATNRVWFNEINLQDPAPPVTNLTQFVELCSKNPTNTFTFSGWRVVATNSSGFAVTNELTSAPTLEGGLTNVAFYVLADAAATDVPLVHQQLIDTLPVDQGPLSICLYYPSGVFADGIVVSFDSSASTLAMVDALTNSVPRVVFAGEDDPTRQGSLGLTNNNDETVDWFNSEWAFAENGWTPDNQNIDQEIDVPPNPELLTVYLTTVPGGTLSFTNNQFHAGLNSDVPPGTQVHTIYTVSVGYVFDFIEYVYNDGSAETNSLPSGMSVYTNIFTATKSVSVTPAFERVTPPDPNAMVVKVEVEAGPERSSARRLSPGQPLVDGQPIVTVTLANSPSLQGIEVYLSYFIGTNKWGTGANGWFKLNTIDPATDPNTKKLLKTGDPTVFDSSEALPVITERGTVIQYIVWGIMQTSSSETMRFMQNPEQTFVTPSWYVPGEDVDLNQKYAGIEGNTRMPYYYVYSCPTGQVWFNEINVWDWRNQAYDNEHAGYLEFCAPATNICDETKGWNLGKWTLVEYVSTNLLGTNFAAFAEVRRVALTNETIATYANSGRGFFTLADGSPNLFNVRKMQSLPAGTTFNTNNTMVHAFKLFRENGAYEAGVVFYLNNAGKFPQRTLAELVDAEDPRMKNAGWDLDGLSGALQLIGDPSNYTWQFTRGLWTGGYINESATAPQTIYSYPSGEPLTDFLVRVILSLISPYDVSGNTVKPVTNETDQVPNMPYLKSIDLPAWFRATNPLPQYVTASSYDKLTVNIPSVNSNYTFNIPLTLDPRLQAIVTDGASQINDDAFTQWLVTYKASDVGPNTTLTGDLLTKYWVNADPAKSLTARTGISAYTVTNMTAWLYVNGTNQVTLNPPAELMVITNATLSGTWGYAAGSDVFVGTNTVIDLPETNTPAMFYRAKLGVPE